MCLRPRVAGDRGNKASVSCATSSALRTTTTSPIDSVAESSPVQRSSICRAVPTDSLIAEESGTVEWLSALQIRPRGLSSLSDLLMASGSRCSPGGTGAHPVRDEQLITAPLFRGRGTRWIPTTPGYEEACAVVRGRGRPAVRPENAQGGSPCEGCGGLHLAERRNLES